ncbi:hypothetical protein C8N35_102236 [Breoghania corrubedonensis]|uniref:Secreted protein n=1 Tax=Breoghania corrubedonensis TaxID=665038 RepID=A0A2T5VCQ9_9HYPH|nr:hypothetical protein [Breoghania corrubedonensis]PTW61525.1 hypothetical protein C8N35_102236 [Breoghania corrubedonensis]
MYRRHARPLRKVPVFAALAAATLFMAAPRDAEARPDTRTFTCAQAKDLVTRSGAITLTTGPATYERFVAHRGQCLRMEITQPAYAPTQDVPQCFIGLRCVPITIRKQYD